MPMPPSHRGGGAARPGHPPTFSAYEDDNDSRRSTQQGQEAPPLRRRGAPVPAPSSLLSTRSSVTRSLHATPVENPYESTPASTSLSTLASSGATAATSPPSHPRRGSAARQRAYDTPTTASTYTTATSASATNTASSTPLPSSSTNTRRSRRGEGDRSSSNSGGGRGTRTPSERTVPTPLNSAAVDTSARAPRANRGGTAPRSLSLRARERSSRTPTPEGDRPRVPPTRGPGSTPPRQQRPASRDTAATTSAARHGPTVVRASSPAAASPSASSLHSAHDAGRQRRGDAHPRRSGSATVDTNRSRSTATSRGSAPPPPHMRQETGVPSPSPALSPAHSSPSATSPIERTVTAAPVMMTNAERKVAEREARKQLRTSLYDGNIKVHGYVAQTAYAQKNPFRRQDFAEFAANPQYQPPAGFDIYSQAMATRVYGLEVSRASQGEFMMQRLVEAAHPATAEERTAMEALLSSTLEKLQVGDWFYKWTRINHVHQRYVWLNLQRGTLMWSVSPKQSVVLNAEVKLSTVTSITPDCLQLESPMRVFYRMTINTPDRCISLATEIRKKFDVWYRVLLQLTTSNLVYGVPGVWGRPSSSVNTTGRGAASRWASRFSPLDAVVNETAGHLGHGEINAQGLLSSSD